MADARPRFPGTNQPENVVRRTKIKLDNQLTGSDSNGYIQLPFPCRSFRFVTSSGIIFEDVLIALGKQDPASSQVGVTIAQFSHVLDPTAVSAVRIDNPVTDISIYSRAAFAGESVTIFAFRDAELALTTNLSIAGAVTVSGAVNATYVPEVAAAVATPITAGITDGGPGVGQIVLATNVNRIGGLIQNLGPDPIRLSFGVAKAWGASGPELALRDAYDLNQIGVLIQLDVYAVCDTGDTADVLGLEIT